MTFNRTQGYQRYYTVAAYMYRELTNNIHSKDANHIRELLTPPSNILGQIFNDPVSNAALALVTWYSKVKSGAVWDHKPEIIRRCNLVSGDMHFPIFGDTTHEWFFDIWSNLHYGYVGTSVGFDEFTLISGANAGEFFGAGGNDPMDDAITRIGIRMWKDYGENIDEHQIAREIVRRKNWLLDVQESREYINARGNFRHIMPMSRGNSR